MNICPLNGEEQGQNFTAFGGFPLRRPKFCHFNMFASYIAKRVELEGQRTRDIGNMKIRTLSKNLYSMCNASPMKM
jgi:hypothetical protein